MRNFLKAMAGAAVMFGASTALAQTSINFEAPTYTGSAAGTSITGQDLWFVPVAGSENNYVATYGTNDFDIGPNAGGGSQFHVARRGTTNFSRAQRDMAYGADGTSGCVTLCYDFNGRFDTDFPGADPNGPANNLASVSVQPYPANGCIFLHIWDDPNLPDTTHSLSFTGYFANGTQVAGRTIIFPGSQFSNIPQNQWMRVCANIDLDTNAVTSMEIGAVCSASADRDVVLVDDPNFGFYLGGGAAGVGPVNQARLFGGGGAGGATGAGNTMAIDNLSTSTPCGFVEVTCGGGGGCPNPGCDSGGVDADFDNNCNVNLSDLSVLLSNFGTLTGATNATGDTDADGDVDLTDLSNLLSRFGNNCN